MSSSIAAIAEHPGRIWNMMETKQYNDAGIYSFKMYDMGLPISIVVDDFLPINENQYTLAKDGSHKVAWPMLIEKAFAKLYGGYNAI